MALPRPGGKDGFAVDKEVEFLQQTIYHALPVLTHTFGWFQLMSVYILAPAGSGHPYEIAKVTSRTDTQTTVITEKGEVMFFHYCALSDLLLI